jgi:tetratricopeptide (TPR) repeat protein
VVRACVLAFAICLAAGCASHRPADAGGPFIHRSQASYADSATFDAPKPADDSSVRPQAPLDPAPDIPKTPQPKSSNLPTIESTDDGLKAALAALNADPSVATYLAVGVAYHRAGVYDEAETNFQQALKLDSKAWPAADGIARVWRDWGFPQWGLPYAYRAVAAAPKSAAAQNTLGTLLFMLGEPEGARTRFQNAVTLDPTAAWAQNNLCYVAFMLGEGDPAIAHCAKAIAIAPELMAAHNNLGLVYAAQGRDDMAKQEFAQASATAAAAYNMGIVHMSRREYRDAVAPFESACHAEPAVAGACAWALEARRLAYSKEASHEASLEAGPLGPATPADTPGLKARPPAGPLAVSRQP